MENDMTIKTLEFIQRLLVAEEAKTKKSYEDARRLRREYETDETVSEDLAEKQKAAVNEYASAFFNIRKRT